MLESCKLGAMVKSCMVPGSHNKQTNKELHFHRLPLGRPSQLKKWLANMKLKNPPVTNCSRLCSAHFLLQCYIRDLKSELMGGRASYILKENAVPTIFDFSSYATVNDAPNTSSAVLIQQNDRSERLEGRNKQKDIQQV